MGTAPSEAQCYFPNGDLASDGEIPCGSGQGVACCPLDWECQDNGLCYLANQNYYGRYACTDQSWQSSGCPSICTHGMPSDSRHFCHLVRELTTAQATQRLELKQSSSAILAATAATQTVPMLKAMIALAAALPPPSGSESTMA